VVPLGRRLPLLEGLSTTSQVVVFQIFVHVLSVMFPLCCGA
jgi:hypothetical protein